jgi:hypothetical protein
MYSSNGETRKTGKFVNIVHLGRMRKVEDTVSLSLFYGTASISDCVVSTYVVGLTGAKFFGRTGSWFNRNIIPTLPGVTADVPDSSLWIFGVPAKTANGRLLNTNLEKLVSKFFLER